MNGMLVPGTLVLALGLSSVASGLAGAENNRLSDKETSQGWKLLFDGKTFSGWQGMKGTAFPSESWIIREGMICTQNDRSGGDIVTVDKYEDFVLELEWKITRGGNSGIKYLVQQEWLNPGFQPDFLEARKRRMWRSAVGFEYQILDDRRLRDRLGSEASGTGALYLLYAPRSKRLNPPGEWNHARIVVQGKRVEHWMNGEKLLECELDSPELFQRIEKTKFRRVPGYGIKVPGHISLQHHGTPVFFRSIKIRKLPGQQN